MNRFKMKIYLLLQTLWRSLLEERFSPETRSEVVPVKSGPALCFRHDMDNLSVSDIDKFCMLDRETGVLSSCFFLEHQLKNGKQALLDMASAGYDVELHSEARPLFSTSIVQLLWLVEAGYRRKLKRQVKKMRRYGLNPLGHCPHTIHNYIGFQTWIDWNVIEQASIGTGLGYVSDYRMIAPIPDGEDRFSEPLPPFIRRLKSQEVMVLPTSWDDKFFFSSYENRYIFRKTDSLHSGKTVDEAFQSALGQFHRCIDADIPCVVNLHPYTGMHMDIPMFELKKKLIAVAKEKNVSVMSLKQVYERTIKNAEMNF